MAAPTTRWSCSRIPWIAARIGRSPELKTKLAAAPHAQRYWRQVADLVLAGDAAIAADRLAERGYRWAEADTRLLAAKQLLEQDLHQDAKEQLEKTLSFYRSVGVTRYINEAKELLSVPVGEPGRPERTRAQLRDS